MESHKFPSQETFNSLMQKQFDFFQKSSDGGYEKNNAYRVSKGKSPLSKGEWLTNAIQMRKELLEGHKKDIDRIGIEIEETKQKLGGREQKEHGVNDTVATILKSAPGKTEEMRQFLDEWDEVFGEDSLLDKLKEQMDRLEQVKKWIKEEEEFQKKLEEIK